MWAMSDNLLNTVKVVLGVLILCALAFGDFFYARRLAPDTDVILVVGAVAALGVYVTQRVMSTR
jgi:hypothetical protein